MRRCLTMLFLAGMAANWAESASARASETNTPASSITGEYGTNGLKMNFREAPLNLVLNYLSEAAGFIVNKQTEIDPTVKVSSEQPVNWDQAIDLISSALKKKGYALTRNGRILTILPIESAKTADTPVVINDDPNVVEKSDEVQTQVIPLHYASAAQMVTNLQVLLPTSASLSVNESANTLILVATKTDIKRMLTIVHALDSSMASGSSVKVRLLRHANAKDIATLVTQLFSPPNTGQTFPANMGNLPFNFPGFANGNGARGPPGTPGAAPQQPEPRQNSVVRRVVAVADERSNAVVIRAPADLLTSIDGIVDKIDQPVTDPNELRVFRLVNAVPSELADELAQLFSPESGHTNQENFVVNNSVPAFFRGRMGPGGVNPSQSEADQHARKFGNVLAVPDPRTSSLIVTAPKALMPQIANVVANLDSDRGKKEIVSVFKLRHADPQDIYQNLQDLFNRSTAHMENNNNQNSFLGRNNPLTQRELQNQQSSASSTVTSGSSMLGSNPSSLGGQSSFLGGTSFGGTP